MRAIGIVSLGAMGSAMADLLARGGAPAVVEHTAAISRELGWRGA